MHALLQAYAAELAADAEDRAAAQRRLAQYHLDTAASAAALLHPLESGRRTQPDATGHRATLNGCADALRWLDARRSEILCVADFGIHEFTVDLSIMLWPYLELGGHHDEAGRLHSVALTAAHELGDRAGEGIAARALGARELRLGQYDDAEVLLEEARALHENEPDGSIRATTTAYAASMRAATGRVPEALAAARSVAELHLTDAMPLSSMALITLGRVHATCARPREAARWLRKAHDVAQGRGHRPVQARALLDLANVHRAGGRAAEARECRERATALAREHGIAGIDDSDLEVI
jgi:tetratricopeptide (TPR) repeat protein